MIDRLSSSLLAGLLGLATMPAPALAQNRLAPLNFQGRYIISVSDADMLASAYVDGQLGHRDGQDALSIIDLGASPQSMEATEIEVSNSVAGPPSAVAVTGDGRWAFVVESFQPAAASDQAFSKLELGTLLTVVNLSDPSRPRIQTAIDIGQRPESVWVNEAGDLVVVTLHPADGRQLAFIPFQAGELGEPSYAQLPHAQESDRISHAEFHPSGEFIAATLVDRNQVVFARVVRNRNGVALEAWGDPVTVGKYPFMGRFTPDGRHYLTTNLQWGPDVEGFWIEAPAGDISSIRFATEPNADGKIVHSAIGRAGTSISPEGIAISPDGRLVVTTNLERSYLPYDDPRITWYSSLTLMELDPETGHLSTVDHYTFDGILPEAAVFDTSGQYLAVANFDHFDDTTPGGSIDFWRLVRDPQLKLVPTDYSVSVTRGVHSMVLVP